MYSKDNHKIWGYVPYASYSPLNLGCGGVHKVGRGSAAPDIEILDSILRCRNKFMNYLKLGQAYIFAPVDYFDLVFADYI